MGLEAFAILDNAFRKKPGEEKDAEKGVKSLSMSKNGPLKPSQDAPASSPVLKHTVHWHFWKCSPDYLSGKSCARSVGP